MELIDDILKGPINILVSFIDPEIGATLSNMATYFAMSESEKSSVTFLHLTNDEIEPHEKKDFSEVVDQNKVTVRSFVKKYDNIATEIHEVAKEYNCNLLLVGINNKHFTPQLFRKYNTLKADPTKSDAEIMNQFLEEEVQLLDNITELLDMNPVTTGLFIKNNLKGIENIFVPVLCLTDIQALIATTIRFLQKESIELMLWDAIGAIYSNPKMQKLYNMYVKKKDSKVNLWDTDKKIDDVFVKKQDLCIIGFDGWKKLINTSLPWIDALPSTLIIKEKSTK